ncbi:MAG: ribosome biogenesis GTPase Der [Caedibacter sp. 38-128]|nr:ribosome biogenesis GTPase Der [Holosporales bacterium]OJX03248.1 MAG: ribosome biogenesis GTPase Der [Caedibacter sp. 38-128]
MTKHLKIAIVGRPNVGKSTLYNRLAGRKLAIVEDTPGVTRDWQKTRGSLWDLELEIYDTAGLEGFESEIIKDQIVTQTLNVLTDVDTILMVIDSREPILASDRKLTEMLRRLKKPIILIANKCEGRQRQEGYLESFTLGLGDPIPFSAAHGEGLDELYQALLPYAEDLEVEEIENTPNEQLKLAIVGRPNVGKSTLMNALLGEERLLTGDQPGITRDAIAIDWSYKGHSIQLVDTAGMRRKARIDDHLERLSVQDSLEAIRYAQVVIIVMDANDPLNKQDLTIASHVLEEGRALIIALNKWDEADQQTLPEVRRSLSSLLSQAKGLRLQPISALKKKNLDELMTHVLEVYQLWNTRISTSQLNRWLEEALARHAPPLSGQTPIRIKYATQIKTRPPTFVLFASKPVDLPASYMRYLETSLRDCFNLPGVPLRLFLRKGKNPYESKSK